MEKEWISVKEKERRICAPNSIYHGEKININSSRDEAILLRIELERLKDFVEFLFEHSEHCDHISQRDAWKEFGVYEAKNSYHRKRIQEQRSKKQPPPPKP